MDWDTLSKMWSYVIILMLIRQAVWRIARALLSVGSLSVLHDILDKQESEDSCFEHCWDQIHSYKYDLVWSLPGCGSSSMSYLYTWWIPPWSSVSTRGDSIIEESHILWLLQQIDIKYYLIRDMVRWWARRLHDIETDIQVTDILSKPRGKVKFVTFPNDLELLRDPLMRVLHVACTKLWKLRRTWGTYWNNKWP